MRPATGSRPGARRTASWPPAAAGAARSTTGWPAAQGVCCNSKDFAVSQVRLLGTLNGKYQRNFSSTKKICGLPHIYKHHWKRIHIRKQYRNDEFKNETSETNVGETKTHIDTNDVHSKWTFCKATCIHFKGTCSNFELSKSLNYTCQATGFWMRGMSILILL